VKSTIIRRGKSGENLQYGFIQMSERDARKAVASLNGTKFMGRKLRLNIAEHVNDRSVPPDRRNLVKVLVSFVSHSNRSFVNEEVLDNIFSEYGEVDDCTMKHYAIAADTGKHSGYGFVYFVEVASALRAMQVLNQELHGHVQGLIIDCHMSYDSADRLSQQPPQHALKVSANEMPSKNESVCKTESRESSTYTSSYSGDYGVKLTSYHSTPTMLYPPHIQTQSSPSTTGELTGLSFSSSSPSSTPTSPRALTTTHLPHGTIASHISTIPSTSSLSGPSYGHLSNLPPHSRSSLSATVYHHPASTASTHSFAPPAPGMVSHYFPYAPCSSSATSTRNRGSTTFFPSPAPPTVHPSAPTNSHHISSMHPISTADPPVPPHGGITLVPMVPYSTYPNQLMYSHSVPPPYFESVSMPNNPNNNIIGSTSASSLNVSRNYHGNDGYGYAVPVSVASTTSMQASTSSEMTSYHSSAPPPYSILVNPSIPPSTYIIDQSASHLEYTQQSETHYHQNSTTTTNGHTGNYINHPAYHYHPNPQYPSYRWYCYQM
jgi:hypothetical protein